MDLYPPPYVFEQPKTKNKSKNKIYPPPKYEVSYNHPYLLNRNIQITIQQINIQPASNICICINKMQKCCLSVYNLMCCEIGCYSRKSHDMRCCGICYIYCPLTRDSYNSTELEQYEICQPDLCVYCNSGYIVTYEQGTDCTVCCIPVKLPLFSLCLLGSIFNNCINCVRNTNHNYLF